MLLPTGRVGGGSVAWSGLGGGARALGLALRSGAVGEVVASAGSARVGNRAAERFRARGGVEAFETSRLTARSGPNCLRESGHMVTFGLDDASRGGIKPEDSFWTKLEC